MVPLDGYGTLAAQKNISLIAAGSTSRVTNYNGSMIGAGVDGDGQPLDNDAQLNISATEKASVNGNIVASGDFTVNSKAIDLRASTTTAFNLHLTGLQGEQANTIDTTDAKITVSKTFTADALKQLTTDRATISAADFIFTAHDFSNIGGAITQTSHNDWLLNFLGNFTNTGGTIKSNARHFSLTADHTLLEQARVEVGQLDLTSRYLSNRSGELRLIGTGLQKINISGQIDNTHGTLLSNGNLHLTLGQLDGLSLLNTAGTISALSGASLTINAEGRIDNTSGRIAATHLLNMRSGQLHNRWGKLLGQQALNITSHALDNQGGLIQSQQLVDIHTQGHTLTNTDSGKESGILSGGVIKLNARELNNHQGLIASRNNININLGLGTFNNSLGTLHTQGKLDIQSGLLNNQSGLIKATQALTLNTHGHALINTDSGKDRGLASEESVTIQAGELDNRGGYLGAQNLSLTSTTVHNQQGTVYVWQDHLESICKFR